MSSNFTDDVDTSDDEDNTLTYFEENEVQLQHVFLTDVSLEALERVAYLVSFTSRSEYDCLRYVGDLLAARHVSTKEVNLELVHIKGKADEKHMNSLLYALIYPLRQKNTLWDLIQVLQKRGRSDILNQLKSFVEDILQKPKNHQNISQCEFFGDITLLESTTTIALEQTQKRALSKEQPSFVHLTATNGSYRKKLLTVFVPHAEEDEKVAKELQNSLNSANIAVKLLCDIDHHIATSECEVLQTVLKYVDFVMPILSRQYLHSIRPVSPSENETEYASNNRFIYRWILSEFRTNNSFNFRIRPVLAPEMNIQQVRNLKNPIFNYPFKLFQDVEKVIAMLKKSKSANSLRSRKCGQLINQTSKIKAEIT